MRNYNQIVEEMVNDFKSGNISENVDLDAIYEDELDELASDELSEAEQADVSDDEIAQTQEEVKNTQEQITESES